MSLPSHSGLYHIFKGSKKGQEGISEEQVWAAGVRVGVPQKVLEHFEEDECWKNEEAES